MSARRDKVLMTSSTDCFRLCHVLLHIVAAIFVCTAVVSADYPPPEVEVNRQGLPLPPRPEVIEDDVSCELRGSCGPGGANARLPFYARNCFCDELCSTYDDCCEDFRPVTTGSRNTAAANLPRNVFSCMRVEEIDTAYEIYVVTKCPRGGVKELRDKCEDERLAEEFYRLPVSGLESGILYRNAYCAVCANETSFLFWRTVHTCVGPPSASTSAPEVDQLMRCPVELLPPDVGGARTPIMPRKCKSHVAECSESAGGRRGGGGGGRRPQKNRRARCTGPTSYVYDGLQVYRNDDCAQCNEITESTCEDQRTPKIELDDSRRTDPLVAAQRPTSISLVVDFNTGRANVRRHVQQRPSNSTAGDGAEPAAAAENVPEGGESEVELGECSKPGEVFDPYVGLCRLVGCGDGTPFGTKVCPPVTTSTTQRTSTVMTTVPTTTTTTPTTTAATTTSTTPTTTLPPTTAQSTTTPTRPTTTVPLTTSPTTPTKILRTPPRPTTVRPATTKKAKTQKPKTTTPVFEEGYEYGDEYEEDYDYTDGPDFDPSWVFTMEPRWAGTTAAPQERRTTTRRSNAFIPTTAWQVATPQRTTIPSVPSGGSNNQPRCQLLPVDHYVIHDNGSASVRTPDQRMVLASQFTYIGNKPFACVPDDESSTNSSPASGGNDKLEKGTETEPDVSLIEMFQFDRVQRLVSLIGVLISIVALCVCLIAQMVLCCKRGCSSGRACLLCLIVCLLLAECAYLLSVLVGLNALPIMDPMVEGQLCFWLAVIVHYILLAAFFWLNVVAMDAARSAPNDRQQPDGSKMSTSCSLFLAYSVYAWVAPAVIVGGSVASDLFQLDEPLLRPYYADSASCWMAGRHGIPLLFALPLAALTVANLILFAVAACRTPSSFDRFDQPGHEYAGFSTQRWNACGALLTILIALTWTSALLAAYLELPILWYVFVALDTTVALFVCVAYAASSEVFLAVRDCCRSQDETYDEMDSKSALYVGPYASGHRNGTNVYSYGGTSRSRMSADRSMPVAEYDEVISQETSI